MTTSGDVRCHSVNACAAVGAPLGLVPGTVEVGDEHLGDGLVVFHDEDASSHSRQPRQGDPVARTVPAVGGIRRKRLESVRVGTPPRNALSVGP